MVLNVVCGTSLFLGGLMQKNHIGLGQSKQVNPVKDYSQVVSWLADNYTEVFGYDFYKEVFPDNECSGELTTDIYKPNAIYIFGGERPDSVQRRIMLKDTWKEDYFKYVNDNDFALCSGLAYRGKANRLENAQRMYAMIFDLDQVGYVQLRTLFLRFGRMPNSPRSLPIPTYIVTSGAGLHLYYVFDKPIDLYPNIKLQAKAFKYALTERLWDPGKAGTTLVEDIQYQGISQGFRMVGSVNNKYGYKIRAFKIGAKIPVELMNFYVSEKDRIDVTKPYRPTQMSLKKAQEKYPEWYERRIVQGQSAGHWVCKKDLYNWWLRQIPKVKGGHRYFYLLCLAVYAVKCGVSYEELTHDMEAVFDTLKSIAYENEFTKKDMDSALEMYDRAYYCFTIDDISKLSGIPIEKNKRNYRKRDLHLAGARAIQQVNDKFNGTNWRKGNGRKPKGEIVWNCRKEHPEWSVSAVAKFTKLSRPTVYKWWNYIPSNEEMEKQYWKEEDEELNWGIALETFGDHIKEDYKKFQKIPRLVPELCPMVDVDINQEDDTHKKTT